jgi:CxxC-x17-CxxC domain-containing protein
MGREYRDKQRSGSGGKYGDRSFGNKRFSNRGGFNNNNRDFGEKVMHDAVCDACGEPCQVPFRPSGGKPIYCDNCFNKNKKTGFNNDNKRNHDFVKRDNNNPQLKDELRMVIDKLDKILQILSVDKKEEKQDKKTLPAEKKTVKKKTTSVKDKKEVKKTAKKTPSKASTKSVAKKKAPKEKKETKKTAKKK